NHIRYWLSFMSIKRGELQTFKENAFAVLDFYCHEAKLNVEVDGAGHYNEEGIRNDEERDSDLEQQGIRVLRYSNSEVMEQTDALADDILEEVLARIREKGRS
ncbi:MAG: DUF559 domain-containing protein, partial [Bacteroidota bacterium]